MFSSRHLRYGERTAYGTGSLDVFVVVLILSFSHKSGNNNSKWTNRPTPWRVKQSLRDSHSRQQLVSRHFKSQRLSKHKFCSQLWSWSLKWSETFTQSRASHSFAFLHSCIMVFPGECHWKFITQYSTFIGNMWSKRISPSANYVCVFSLVH